MLEFDQQIRSGGMAAIRQASRFLRRDDPVNRTLAAFARRLDELGIEYAIVGGMALVAHGYLRTTAVVDVLVDQAGLDAVHRALDGRGYLPPFEGSRNLRDTTTGVRIEFVVAGQFPGDGKPKPVAFPDPRGVAVERDGIRFVTLEKLVELKLASGLTHPGRLRDLADVQELIRELQLDAAFAERLNSFVRAAYLRLLAGLD